MMKKLTILLFSIAVILIISCEKNEEIIQDINSVGVDMSDFYIYTNSEEGLSKAENNGKSKNCQTMTVLNRQLKENSGLYNKMYKIEEHTRKIIASKKPEGKPGGGNNGGGGTDPIPYTGSIIIPVIVNILENNFGDVSQAQIDSQIVILNEDFNNYNPNTSGAPTEFSGLVANCDITFTLVDINRKISTKYSWGTNDSMKLSSQGGIDVTNPSQNLNIWVCNIGGGILGYAQFPGGADTTDGVVIGIDYFGETSGVYGDGRTATHEIGHWLNLRHIWGMEDVNKMILWQILQVQTDQIMAALLILQLIVNL